LILYRNCVMLMHVIN